MNNPISKRLSALALCLVPFALSAGELPKPAKQYSRLAVENAKDHVHGQICGIDENGQSWQQLQSELTQQLQTKLKRQKMVGGIDKQDVAVVNGNGVSGRYYIPVVFHIYGSEFNCNNGGNCLTDAKIIDALNKTNEDFRGLNTEDGPIAPEFQAIRENLNVEFVLAKTGPNGQATNGIVRHNREQAGYGDGSEFNSQIAADSWDNFKYMNVYIMKDLYDDGATNNSGVAWYPQMSMSQAGTARVVYNGQYLGTNTNENFRSVLTHEFGHFLNLPHTFDQNACSIENEAFCSLTGDRSCDTPQMSLSTDMANNAVNCLGQTTNTENFMHYTDNYAMFTQDQVKRMTAALHGSARSSLWSNSNLIATGLSEYTSNDPHPWDGSGVDALPQGTLIAEHTNLSAAKGAVDHFATDIPRGTEAVAFYLNGYTQDPDMYVTKGTKSTQQGDNWTADYISFNSAGSAEFVGVLAPSTTEAYYTTVHAFSEYTNAKLSIVGVDDASLCDGCTRQFLLDAKDLSATKGSTPKTYSFDVPDNASKVVLVMPGNYTGDPDLHVSRNKPVSLQSYDCRPFSAPKLSEYCEFNQGGTFNVLIDPFLDYSGAKLRVYYTIAGASNQLPTANAVFPGTGVVNEPVSFSSAGSSDADGVISAYSWDFGDGQSSSASNPTHTYTQAGTYSVSLTVIDNEGGQGTASGSVVITGGGSSLILDDICVVQGPTTSNRMADGEAVCLPQRSRVYLSIPAVNAHQSLAITMAHGAGNADLVYRNGGWATNSSYDARSDGATNSECIYIPNIASNANYWGYITVENVTGSASLVVDFDTDGCRTTP